MHLKDWKLHKNLIVKYKEAYFWTLGKNRKTVKGKWYPQLKKDHERVFIQNQWIIRKKLEQKEPGIKELNNFDNSKKIEYNVNNIEN
jgi:hypothetical protein